MPKPIGIFFQGTSTNLGHQSEGELISTLALQWEEESKGPIFLRQGPGNYYEDGDNYITSWLGAIDGSSGNKNWNQNTDDARDFIKQHIREHGTPPYIAISGHSRGGVSCYMLANKLAEDPDTCDIPVQILAVDPVPGDLPYKYTVTPEQASLAENVKACTILIAGGCGLLWFTSLIAKHTDETRLTVKQVALDHTGIDGLQSSIPNVLQLERLKSHQSRYDLVQDYCAKSLGLSPEDRVYDPTDDGQPPGLNALVNIRSKYVMDFREVADVDAIERIIGASDVGSLVVEATALTGATELSSDDLACADFDVVYLNNKKAFQLLGVDRGELFSAYQQGPEDFKRNCRLLMAHYNWLNSQELLGPENLYHLNQKVQASPEQFAKNSQCLETVKSKIEDVYDLVCGRSLGDIGQTGLVDLEDHYLTYKTNVMQSFFDFVMSDSPCIENMKTKLAEYEDEFLSNLGLQEDCSRLGRFCCVVMRFLSNTLVLGMDGWIFDKENKAGVNRSRSVMDKQLPFFSQMVFADVDEMRESTCDISHLLSLSLGA
ncbi:hypothetical protein AVI51_07470 [Piscirickettsia salmonis]|uniref:hypothetical protein n=1 Tax=Piscirickettsia salmonis TaxID=1238 RepID=UPI0002EC1255|nr:hypothetical protein [Piscirickettsia salmonis]ALA25915.1 XPC-binding domain protein [Piscirickettsia salmonis]APS43386.1 hypothetical protein AVI48_02680 [Piscirickettsia salmonis]APS46737.1 hypothetical protein AVI49_03285 [Piscirickettsia salmonis]APS50710.1 hypothetical protein AVI50_07555 [Piscirickettsia salmonis]APS53914.1 hypothetical protein AVI51_07470 [Piscirickettsia salmonis]